MRFRRTKDELERGLTPAQAQEARKRFPLGKPRLEDLELLEKAGGVKISAKDKKNLRNGEIVLRIRPVKGVDADYFEHLTSGEILISQDEHFYKWLDHLLEKVYTDAGVNKFFQDMLDDGIGQLLTTRQKPKDVK